MTSLVFELPNDIACDGELTKLDRERLHHEALGLPDWRAVNVLRELLKAGTNCESCAEDHERQEKAVAYAIETLTEAAKMMRKGAARLLVLEALRALKGGEA